MNWPLWNRNPELRVRVKLNNRSVQCRTASTVSVRQNGRQCRRRTISALWTKRLDRRQRGIFRYQSRGLVHACLTSLDQVSAWI